MQNIYYVYAYIDPITLLPFYIGKGKDRRMFDHLKSNRNSHTGRMLYYKIQSLRKSNLEPIVIIVNNNLTEKASFELERICISIFGKKSDKTGILLNLTDGGEGSSGIKRTLIQRKRRSLQLMGHILSEETKQKISMSNKGKILSKEHTEKLRIKSLDHFGVSYRLKSPDGTIHEGKGMKSFCKDHSLDFNYMRYVNRGTKSFYKGWTRA